MSKWYEGYEKKPKLDYSKPIMAIDDRRNYQFLLIKDTNGYFNWLSINNGNWNSSANWENPFDAIKSYECYRIVNVKITELKGS